MICGGVCGLVHLVNLNVEVDCVVANGVFGLFVVAICWWN